MTATTASAGSASTSTAVFSSWSALRERMLNEAADFLAGKSSIASYTIAVGGSTRQVTYRSITEFIAGLKFVEQMAREEIQPPAGRTYATPGGWR